MDYPFFTYFLYLRICSNCLVGSSENLLPERDLIRDLLQSLMNHLSGLGKLAGPNSGPGGEPVKEKLLNHTVGDGFLPTSGFHLFK